MLYETDCLGYWFQELLTDFVAVSAENAINCRDSVALVRSSEVKRQQLISPALRLAHGTASRTKEVHDGARVDGEDFRWITGQNIRANGGLI